MKFFKDAQTSYAPNLFSKGTKITGNVVCEGDIRIDDSFKGNIKTKGDVTIGSFGSIEGDVICSNIEISGQLTGRILAKMIKLKSNSVVNGDILTSKIEIEPGSIFLGSCKMEDITEKTKFKRKRKIKLKENLPSENEESKDSEVIQKIEISIEPEKEKIEYENITK